MATLYDSGWINVNSGTINAGVDTSDVQMVRVFFAGSGSNAPSAVALSWSAGLASPLPWRKVASGSQPPPTSPILTGTYTVAAPAANAKNEYRIGLGQSGSVNYLDSYVPDSITVMATPGAASYARVVVEGH
jgi:hypothetical protein